MRQVRTDRYGIRTILEVDGTPIKVEFVREDRIQLLVTTMKSWAVDLHLKLTHHYVEN